jgi:hypothetical protein
VSAVKGEKGTEIEFEKRKNESSRDSAFSETRVSIPDQIKIFISPHQHRQMARAAASLVPSVYQLKFIRRLSCCCVKLATQCRLVPRLGTLGVISAFRPVPSECAA